MISLTNPINLLVLSLSVASSAFGALFTDPSQLPQNKNYDFIIVGGKYPNIITQNKVILTIFNLAGAGGSVLANRLTEVAGFQVLLIEAGSALVFSRSLVIPLTKSCF